MHYRRISSFTLFGIVLSLLLAAGANAYSLSTPTCPTNILKDSSVVAIIENISTDKSSFQAVCLQGEKPISTNIMVKAPELQSVLKGFEKGDHIVLEYKQENGQNILQSLLVETKKLDWWWTLLALILSMFLLWSIGKIILMWGGERKGWLDLINGLDNRYSSSKTQITLWFFILISSYIATNVVRSMYGGGLDFVGGVTIPQNLLLLSGLSAFTFVAAKGITQSKVDEAKEGDSGKQGKSYNPDRPRFANLLQNDKGDVDLGNFQMIIVTGLAIVFYSIQVISFLSIVELHHTVSLPDLDTTILSVFGLGQGSYLVKKFLSPASSETQVPPALSETST